MTPDLHQIEYDLPVMDEGELRETCRLLLAHLRFHVDHLTWLDAQLLTGRNCLDFQDQTRFKIFAAGAYIEVVDLESKVVTIIPLEGHTGLSEFTVRNLDL
jgi:hypothetical protein